MRRALAAGLALACWTTLVLLVPLTGGVGAPPPDLDPEAPDAEERAETVRPTGGESGVWPWLAPRPQFDRHSPINVLVTGSGDAAIRALDAAGRQRSAAGGAGASAATDLDWEPTVGSPRYAYLQRHPGERTWVRETEHLQRGDYYGRRVHLRCYAAPGEREDEAGNWLAIQAHVEHFDWFTLRHEVEGLEAAEARAASDLATHPDVSADDVEQRDLGNDDATVSDGDDLTTVVALAFAAPLSLSLALAPPILGAAAPGSSGDAGSTSARGQRRTVSRRRDARLAALAAAIVGLVLGVRAGGIALERHAAALSAYQIAALCYPVLAVGLPASVHVAARELDRPALAGVVASLATVGAVGLDYAAIGIETVPTSILLHRAGVALALGLVAAGAARGTDFGIGGIGRDASIGRLTAAGGLCWLALLVVALLDLV